MFFRCSSRNQEVWVVGFGLVDSLALVPFNLHISLHLFCLVFYFWINPQTFGIRLKWSWLNKTPKFDHFPVDSTSHLHTLYCKRFVRLRVLIKTHITAHPGARPHYPPWTTPVPPGWWLSLLLAGDRVSSTKNSFIMSSFGYDPWRTGLWFLLISLSGSGALTERCHHWRPKEDRVSDLSTSVDPWMWVSGFSSAPHGSSGFSPSPSQTLSFSISPSVSLCLDSPSISDSLLLLFCLVEKGKGEESGSERKEERR